MTLDEWKKLAYFIENAWKGDFDDDKVAAYFPLLRQYEAADVQAALHRIARTGSPWRPTVPEILGMIDRDPSWPSWSEAWDGLMLAMRTFSHDDVEPLNEEAALGFLRESVHPVIAGWVAAEGAVQLWTAPLFDPEYGAVRQRDLERRFGEYGERVRERVGSGLSLEEATSSSRRLRAGLQRLDPAASLGLSGATAPYSGPEQRTLPPGA